ncbi:cytochrome c maturation protein CcmE [Aquisediminimonas sediminicola]|uniref:cytochrome c maturation protein CcmE n=1 Tax=Alteraquisediminimonas sediminicola TaxID=2676787 RepID=UPI001C8F022B
MKAKNQRLILIVAAVVAMLGAVLLAMSGLKDQAAYFYAPSDVLRSPPALDRDVRLGGMVRTGSVKKLADGVTIRFVVEDERHAIPVEFKGIVPDLFREGSGVVAEGKFVTPGQFVASNILAKHDERYMPPQMAGDKHKTGRVS